MEWVIFDDADCASLAEMNAGTEYKVRPRLIDNPASPLAGRFVAPVGILDGASGEYWRDLLANHQRATASPDGLFTPPED
ncbi:hypothetical protein [Paracoccus sp. NSM]|uniref:hypothetical protein n=1 Tax=Paracoccus sp. NSM TaxID=3457784 RepID=UPI00403662F6